MSNWRSVFVLKDALADVKDYAERMSRRTAKERVKGAKEALYREHILDAAEQVFANSGYEDAKVVAMSEAAGMSLATLYRGFQTKWDIYCAVHARRTAALGAYLNERIAGITNPLELFLASISAYFEFHARNPNYLRMHLRSGHAWSTPQSLRSEEQIAAWNRGVAMATQAFAAAIDAGLCVNDENPKLMARTLIAMHQVRLADWVERGMKEPVDVVLDKIHRQFIRTFCRPEFAERLGKAK